MDCVVLKAIGMKVTGQVFNPGLTEKGHCNLERIINL